MFIQTEDTPNPATLKFLPGREVLGSGGLQVTREEAADRSPLAKAVYEVDGVVGVFLGPDFVSVTKSADADWATIRALILAAIMDVYASGQPVVREGATQPEAEPEYEGEVAEIVAEIKALLDQRVRPAVAQDGGDITFHAFDVDTGVVQLHMRGACAGCPSSTFTLKQGVENLFRHYVPEVKRVEPVMDEAW
ncbi:MAG: NifU family protein [Maricaulaceae bacterium]